MQATGDISLQSVGNCLCLRQLWKARQLQQMEAKVWQTNWELCCSCTSFLKFNCLSIEFIQFLRLILKFCTSSHQLSGSSCRRFSDSSSLTVPSRSESLPLLKVVSSSNMSCHSRHWSGLPWLIIVLVCCIFFTLLCRESAGLLPAHRDLLGRFLGSAQECLSSFVQMSLLAHSLLTS